MFLPHIVAQTRLDTRAPSYMTPAGAPGASEASLGWALTITAIVVTAIVAAVLIAAVLRNHDDLATSGRSDAGKGTSRVKVVSGVRWIYTGLAITVVILLAAFGATVATLAHTAHAPRRPPITLAITAHQWWWEIRVQDSLPGDEFVTANEAHVPVGVPVLVRLQSQDVIHSFWVPELGGKMDVIPGQLNETWLQANRAGIYRGACAEYCGLQHAHMAFAIIAEPPREFEAWAASQRAAAAQSAVAPTVAAQTVAASPVAFQNASQTASPNVSHGQTVFLATCSGCHAVRGTPALGRVGPDLTHVASRMTIGAGLIDNTPANLTNWVQNAQAMKPGVLMPKMDLRHDDVAAVVAYLMTLR